MSTEVTEEQPDTLATLLARLGDIPAERVLLRPPPGTATEADLLAAMHRTGRPFELVDGTLVEKPVGFCEGVLAARLIGLLTVFLLDKDLGVLAGADATMRLTQGLVRLPDVSFFRWEKLPGGVLPAEPIPNLSPDLAIEVLSTSNTKAEMERKRRECFLAGCELVWLVDAKARRVIVFTPANAEDGTIKGEGDILDGGSVLPGLALPVKRIFERMPPARPARSRKKPRS